MRTVFKSLILTRPYASDLTSADAGETIYFLVGETHRMVSGYNDSYVLPLSRAEDIAHARYLISRFESSCCRHTDYDCDSSSDVCSSDLINRNFLDPKFPKWSWQVEQFLRFGDGTAEDLDGSPT